MSLAVLERSLPAYAEALKREMTSLSGDTSLSEGERAGCFIAAALASRNAEVIIQTVNSFARKVPLVTQIAARRAAVVAALTAPTARSAPLIITPTSDVQSPLSRAIGSAPPGVETREFGLWVVAAWIVSGGPLDGRADHCLLREARISDHAVRTAVRIASAVSALAVALDSEAALAPEPPTSI